MVSIPPINDIQYLLTAWGKGPLFDLTEISAQYRQYHREQFSNGSKVGRSLGLTCGGQRTEPCSRVNSHSHALSMGKRRSLSRLHAPTTFYSTLKYVRSNYLFLKIFRNISFGVSVHEISKGMFFFGISRNGVKRNNQSCYGEDQWLLRSDWLEPQPPDPLESHWDSPGRPPNVPPHHGLHLYPHDTGRGDCGEYDGHIGHQLLEGHADLDQLFPGMRAN